jgi:hypothetical protein
MSTARESSAATNGVAAASIGQVKIGQANIEIANAARQSTIAVSTGATIAPLVTPMDSAPIAVMRRLDVIATKPELVAPTPRRDRITVAAAKGVLPGTAPKRRSS